MKSQYSNAVKRREDTEYPYKNENGDITKDAPELLKIMWTQENPVYSTAKQGKCLGKKTNKAILKENRESEESFHLLEQSLSL